MALIISNGENPGTDVEKTTYSLSEPTQSEELRGGDLQGQSCRVGVDWLGSTVRYRCTGESSWCRYFRNG